MRTGYLSVYVMLIFGFFGVFFPETHEKYR